MAAENSVLFKVFVTIGVDEPEVRRFSVDRSVVASYEYMKAKIQSIFPALRENNFTLSWKDEEGDDVLISSDDEMILALSSIKEDLKKLYVKISVPKASSPWNIPFMPPTSPIAPMPQFMPFSATAESCNFAPPPSESTGNKRPWKNTQHTGVVCDGCEGPVNGYRYKCVVCPDYDLCSTCEAKNMHHEHVMLRMPEPVGRMGPRIQRIIMKHLKRSGAINRDDGAAGECPFMSKRQCKDNKQPESGEEKHGRHHGRRHHGRHGGHHEEGRKHHEEGRQHGRPRCHRMGSGWLDTVTAYMNEFANLAGDIGSQAAAAATASAGTNTSASASASVPQATAQASAPQQTPAGDGVPTNGNDFVNAGLNVHAEYLRNVGRTVAEILDPLGINVEIDVRPKVNDTENKSQTSQSSREETPKPKEAVNKESPVIEINDGSSSSSDDDSSDGDMGQGPERWTLLGPKDGADGRQIGFDLEKITKEFHKQMEIHAQAMQNNKPSAPSASTGIYPTIPLSDTSAPMDIEIEKVVAPPTVVTPPTVATPPSAPQQETAPSTTHTLRPEIAESYNRMLAMGFKDDGGRLIRLLETKNGNISEVLDVLSMNIPK